jgi:hypothetical protein
MHWYQPQYLPSVEEASNRLQFLSPHFAPVTTEGEDLTTGYSLQRVDVNKLGINLSFTKSGVNTSSQYYWSWWGGYVAPTSTAFTDDIVVSVVYSNVSYFEIFNNERAVGFPATWCVDYIHRSSGGNSTICVPSEADAHALIDALGTLVAASGQSLDISPGVTVRLMTDKELRKHPERAGVEVSRMDTDGPPAQAGIRDGDILRSINGQPCIGQEFFRVFNEAVRTTPQGGDLHVEILRKNNPMAYDLHYPNPETGVAALRQQGTAPSARHPVGTVIQIPGAAQAAPPSGVHFGFEVRPVKEEDVAIFGLAKARGMVVMNVTKGGLADTMGFLAGDVILEVNNSEIGDMDLFVQFVSSGAIKSFRVRRKGQALELTVPQSL